jgi:DHA1 family multidrug resistance protein-like MFS transporter
MRTSNRRNLLILAFSLLVVMLGYGLVIPIIPFYIEDMGAGGTELGLLVASYAVMRLICGPIWGSWSDRVGRKPLLMIGVLGYGLTMVLFGLATQLWQLFAARILSGVLSSATAPTTMAYIADSTSERDRGGGMGILGTAAGLGTIFGPAVGGLLAQGSLSLPFFLAGGVSLLALILIALLLPESLPEAQRSASSAGEARLSVRALWAGLSGPLGRLYALAFLMTGGLMLFFGIFGLYALDRFGYGPEQVGVVFMVLGFVTILGQGALAGPLTKRYGEAHTLSAGFLAAAPALLLILLAEHYATVLVTVGLFGLITAVLVPAVTALTSRMAVQSQGVTMGLSNSFISLGRIAGPLLGGPAYDLDYRLPFVAGSAVLLLGFLASLPATPRSAAHG